jgi:quinoprotein glucose dehydrogenase
MMIDFGIARVHGVRANLAVTSGGLLFSATVEHKIKAHDRDTGKVVWTTPLPGGAEGCPAVYQVDGREYIVVGSRGAYVTFALPAEESKKLRRYWL